MRPKAGPGVTRRGLLVLLAGLPAALAGLRPGMALAMSFGKEQVRCATCHYWSGTRKEHSQERVVCEYNERGRCANPQSDYNNLWVGALNACNRYKRWDQLNP